MHSIPQFSLLKIVLTITSSSMTYKGIRDISISGRALPVLDSQFGHRSHSSGILLVHINSLQFYTPFTISIAQTISIETNTMETTTNFEGHYWVFCLDWEGSVFYPQSVMWAKCAYIQFHNLITQLLLPLNRFLLLHFTLSQYLEHNTLKQMGPKRILGSPF